MSASPFTKRVLLLAITFVFLIIGIVFSRTYIPAWPGDFTAYLAAGYALEEDSNPYNQADANKCLIDNGLDASNNLPFLYSPAFALPFTAVKYIGAIWIRRIWFTILHISFWFGLFLLIKKKKQQKKSIVLMIIFGLILLFVGPYRSAAKWGQATVLLFFVASFVITRKRDNSISGVFLSSIPLIKPALFAPILALRGKAWFYLVTVTLLCITISIQVTGVEPWRQYANALNQVSSEWDLSMYGNRSLAGNVYRVVGKYSENYIRGDMGNRIERIKRAGKIRELSSLIVFILIATIIITVIGVIGKARLNQFYLSNHFAPLLFWISLLISPLAYDHYGLFLLPLLIHSIFLDKPTLYLPAIIAFVCWAFIPNMNNFISNNTFSIFAETVRPFLLILVTVQYTKVTSALFPYDKKAD